MKLSEYISIDRLFGRIAEGYVNVHKHNTFPLVMYTYSRSATFDNVWDDITCKCRCLIVNAETGDIVARSFEKFFNYASAGNPETLPDALPKDSPTITDKLDGNLITLYKWDGEWYAASKGSFHSKHADWANHWLHENAELHFLSGYKWPRGYTPVFEMIAEELEHHVVHYGEEASGLYLTALINTETGEELPEAVKAIWAATNEVPLVPELNLTLEAALKVNEKNAEGYVLAWPRFRQPPFRVKVKFIDFLRLQKLIHHTGPKEILDYMRRPELQCYLDEALDPARSHPVFISYVKQWMERFDQEYMRIDAEAFTQFEVMYCVVGRGAPRKAYAEYINKQHYPAIMFARLDKKPAMAAKQVWKQVEPLAKTEDIHGLVTQEE
jgi:RNA ligase